jgi:branched-chain amino acid aminotransferase
MSVIPFDQRDGTIWYDGQYVPWKEATLHVLTHGLHYASSVFEGQRAYNGKIFKLEEHTQRFRKSAQILGFDLPYSDAEINEACRELIKKNNITDGYFRPVAWRGSEMMAVSAQQTKIHVAIACWEWPSYFNPELRQKGLKLVTSSWKRPSPESAPVHAKAAGLYMICTLSKHAAEQAGYHDALMLDYRGQIAECTGANIFFVTQKGELHTPKPDCFLDGITRRTVMDLARQHQITVIERAIMPKELPDFTEVFITGSAAEVTAIGSIDEHRYTPGKITQTLRDAYDKLVRS